MLNLDGEFKIKQRKFPFCYNGKTINYFSIAIVKTSYYILHLNIKDVDNNEIKILH